MFNCLVLPYSSGGSLVRCRSSKRFRLSKSLKSNSIWTVRVLWTKTRPLEMCTSTEILIQWFGRKNLISQNDAPRKTEPRGHYKWRSKRFRSYKTRSVFHSDEIVANLRSTSKERDVSRCFFSLYVQNKIEQFHGAFP